MKNWFKKAWKKILAVVAVLTAGGIVVFNNGERVTITPSSGAHLLKPDFGVVYMNSAKQIELKAGQRYIQIGMVIDGEEVIQAFADTLDTDTDIGIIGKFTQCKK